MTAPDAALEEMRQNAIREAQLKMMMMQAHAQHVQMHQPHHQYLHPAAAAPGHLVAHVMQATVNAQLEAMRQRELHRQQMLLQAKVQRERREAELLDEQEATAAGGTKHGAIADAAVVDAAGSDEAVSPHNPEPTQHLKIKNKSLGKNPHFFSLPDAFAALTPLPPTRPPLLPLSHPSSLAPRSFTRITCPLS